MKVSWGLQLNVCVQENNFIKYSNNVSHMNKNMQLMRRKVILIPRLINSNAWWMVCYFSLVAVTVVAIKSGGNSFSFLFNFFILGNSPIKQFSNCIATQKTKHADDPDLTFWIYSTFMLRLGLYIRSNSPITEIFECSRHHLLPMKSSRRSPWELT